jgi:hypothetical protein
MLIYHNPPKRSAISILVLSGQEKKLVTGHSLQKLFNDHLSQVPGQKPGFKLFFTFFLKKMSTKNLPTPFIDEFNIIFTSKFKKHENKSRKIQVVIYVAGRNDHLFLY